MSNALAIKSNPEVEMFFVSEWLANAENADLAALSQSEAEAVICLAKRIMLTQLSRGSHLKYPKDAVEYLQVVIGLEQREIFFCIFLDCRRRVISCESLFAGTVSSVQVHPRMVVQRALKFNASAVIIAHNHPSGIPEPSEADERMTNRLREALALIDTALLDHIIVCPSSAVSFAELGLL